jgi:hypothetical protein
MASIGPRQRNRRAFGTNSCRLDQSSNANGLDWQPARKALTGAKGVSTALANRADWFAVYDGQTCIGHFISRGRQGIEAFDAEERSLGLFATRREAFRAVSKAHDRS